MSTLELAGLILAIELALVAWFVLFVLMRQIRRLKTSNAELAAELNTRRKTASPTGEASPLLESVTAAVAVATLTPDPAPVEAVDPIADMESALDPTETDDLDLAFRLDQGETAAPVPPLPNPAEELPPPQDPEQADDFDETTLDPDEIPPVNPVASGPSEDQGRDELDEEELADLFDLSDTPPSPPKSTPPSTAS